MGPCVAFLTSLDVQMYGERDGGRLRLWVNFLRVRQRMQYDFGAMRFRV